MHPNKSSGVTRTVHILLFLLFPVSALAQLGNLRYAHEYSGHTQGERIAAAQTSCPQRTPNQCIVILTAELASLPIGVIPAKRENTTWIDNRVLGHLAVLGDTAVKKCVTYPGDTAGQKLTSCLADLPATGGVADATHFQETENDLETLNITTPNTHLVTGMATFRANQIQFQGVSGFSWICFGTIVRLADHVNQSLLAIVDSRHGIVSNCSFDGNRKHNTTGHTVRIRSGARPGRRSTDILFARNSVRNGAFTNLITDGTADDPVERVRIVDNLFVDSVDFNIAFEIGTRESTAMGNSCYGGLGCISTDDGTDRVRPAQIEAVRNIAHGSTSTCFDVSRSDHVESLHNICYGPIGDNAIASFRYRDSTHIHSQANISQNSAADGFRVDRPNTLASTFISLVEDQAYHSASQGFIVINSTDVTVRGATCRASNDHCFQVSDSSRVRVEGSRSEEAGLNGFMFDGSNTLCIRGNVARNSGKRVGCGTDCNGFEINAGNKADQADLVLFANRAYDSQEVSTQEYGLEVRGTLFDLLDLRIVDNDFSGNALGEIDNPNGETLYGTLAKVRAPLTAPPFPIPCGH